MRVAVGRQGGVKEFYQLLTSACCWACSKCARHVRELTVLFNCKQKPSWWRVCKGQRLVLVLHRARCQTRARGGQATALVRQLGARAWQRTRSLGVTRASSVFHAMGSTVASRGTVASLDTTQRQRGAMAALVRSNARYAQGSPTRGMQSPPPPIFPPFPSPWRRVQP